MLLSVLTMPTFPPPSSGALHMTPLQGVLQLRPSLSYLDKADVGVKKLEVASDEGGDTTESEGEEVKPITVRFAKRENIAKAKQKKVGRRKTFTEADEGTRSVEIANSL